ncbi:hypothetical protein SYNPS1DRAFT_26249 [Syncephalis pseudoplumigaleata]|uniref:HIT-type domain-containing protein n=1 Tax=Syncephalis pseudoplumigaleata TaxID=1712513 RepID=A0A4P9Z692_9FUNG|nr:hypothetical protein SYNPS1DRAFT_26249 [Syncephalis pseudoplumigaleata]|eukprot:RKP28163.1 hypothetical protein SYNPS1DRAFT_26249 [Syncephalis pseudoplumigaleata]
MADTEANLCACCQKAAAKYRCPRCEVCTCSLACVQAHKRQTGCSGQRDRTAYISMKEFDVNQLASDIRFLEEGVDKRSSAERSLAITAGHAPRHNPRQRAPLSRGERIAKWAYTRCKVTVRSLAVGMRRQQENRTSWDGKQKHMLWTVQVMFGTSSTGHSVLLHRIADTSPLDSIVQMARKRRQGKQDADGDEAADSDAIKHLLLRRVDSPANAPIYYALAPTTPLFMALENKTVIEYPTITVIDADQPIPATWHVEPCVVHVDEGGPDATSARTEETVDDPSVTTTHGVEDDAERARTFHVQEPDSNDENDAETVVGTMMQPQSKPSVPATDHAIPGVGIHYDSELEEGEVPMSWPASKRRKLDAVE